MRRTVALGLLAVLAAACGANSNDMQALRDGQREIEAKLADLERKVDQVAAHSMPAAQPAQTDPDKVYDIPVGDSPVRGPANAPVVLVEFSDFQ